jgi:hypothetical protein
MVWIFFEKLNAIYIPIHSAPVEAAQKISSVSRVQSLKYFV